MAESVQNCFDSNSITPAVIILVLDLTGPASASPVMAGLRTDHMDQLGDTQTCDKLLTLLLQKKFPRPAIETQTHMASALYYTLPRAKDTQKYFRW